MRESNQSAESGLNMLLFEMLQVSVATCCNACCAHIAAARAGCS